MERARRTLAGLSLLTLALSLASSFPYAETRARLTRLRQAISEDLAYRPDAMSFWFDPDYAGFLEEVKRATPENATVAILAPESPDLYRYQAVYRLAPRRVVGRSREAEADFVAAYRTDAAGRPRGTSIANGRLWKR